jgi:hypothetical protein
MTYVVILYYISLDYTVCITLPYYSHCYITIHIIIYYICIYNTFIIIHIYISYVVHIVLVLQLYLRCQRGGLTL